jgi:hypothetical protein
MERHKLPEKRMFGRLIAFELRVGRDGKLSQRARTENQGNSGSEGVAAKQEPMGLPFPKRPIAQQAAQAACRAFAPARVKYN